MTEASGTATTRSILNSEAPREEALVQMVNSASVGSVGGSSASTITGRVRGRFGAYVLPFFASAAAAVGAPMPAITRRFYSGGEISGSPVSSSFWVFDDLAYSEEVATLEQISALNALLALPAVEDFRLDLSE
ncbi:MAG: hypothetical protein DLM64_08875 [Solirubrobacterales bacterium]|nr:MAG: hypothetical protein DLM64_08875 [Solirubrobacterales bacterium]